jgi:hypothetical protein
MKLPFVLLAATLVACATTSPDPAAQARQHQRNVALAQSLGYDVVTRNGQSRFCGTIAPTGSHIVPACISEAQWEQLHPLAGLNVPPAPLMSAESGRSPYAGTLGY